MDFVEQLKQDGYIVSKSINCVAYIVYCCSAFVKIVQNEDGFKLFAIKDTELNKKFYDEYKDMNEEIYVNLRSYNNIIKMLKNLCKNYK